VAPFSFRPESPRQWACLGEVVHYSTMSSSDPPWSPTSRGVKPTFGVNSDHWPAYGTEQPNSPWFLNPSYEQNYCRVPVITHLGFNSYCMFLSFLLIGLNIITTLGTWIHRGTPEQTEQTEIPNRSMPVC
jgi:hypothetical protein